jgi:hypothetical protein|tara:strand:- start:311 stop:904 length:594 start_codon:yes stop_codon:yes gene_type:complete
MEITYPNLLNYIRVYDDVLDKQVLQTFLKICEENPNFNEAGITRSKEEPNFVNKQIRDVKSWGLVNIGEESKTNVFWANYFHFKFMESLQRYNQEIGNSFSNFSIKDMQVLKYEKHGKYNFHVDHGDLIPRTFSCIYFLNDNYEGGELCFKFPDTPQESIIEKKANRMIVWPSNFLYPHAVKPVTKGTRYSVVSWAL